MRARVNLPLATWLRPSTVTAQSRYQHLLAAGTALLGTALLPAVANEDKQVKKPNIILCMTDDQGWGDVGYNGNPVAHTPNLDQMAAEGLRFDRFYAAAPVCSPTRASCLMGRNPFRSGVFHANRGILRPEEFTLMEFLKAKNYTTGHFGKWHLGTLTKTVKDSALGTWFRCLFLNRGQGPDLGPDEKALESTASWLEGIGPNG